MPSFLQRLDENFTTTTLENRIPAEAFRTMSMQKAFHGTSSKYISMEYSLGELLGKDYIMAREEFAHILDSTKRASA